MSSEIVEIVDGTENYAVFKELACMLPCSI